MKNSTIKVRVKSKDNVYQFKKCSCLNIKSITTLIHSTRFEHNVEYHKVEILAFHTFLESLT